MTVERASKTTRMTRRTRPRWKVQATPGCCPDRQQLRDRELTARQDQDQRAATGQNLTRVPARLSQAVRSRAGPKPACSPVSSVHARAIEQD